MILELNDLLIGGASHTYQAICQGGSLTCLAEGSAELRTRLLLTILGLEPVKAGYITLDYEPLTLRSAVVLRRYMSYAPRNLETVGVVTPFEPPTVQEIFDLEANSDIAISNGILAEEIRRITGGSAESAEKHTGNCSPTSLAVASLLQRPLLLIDHPADYAVSYLQQKAREGTTIIVSASSQAYLDIADRVM